MSIFDQIKLQSSVVVDRLYGSSDPTFTQSRWACMAVFQSLSMLSRCFVMKALFVDTPFPLSALMSVVAAQSMPTFYEAMDELQRLRIFVEVAKEKKPSLESIQRMTSTQGEPLLQLNIYFRESLKLALSFPIEPWSDTKAFAQLESHPPPSMAEAAAADAPDIDFLDEYSTSRWEVLLGYLVNVSPRPTTTTTTTSTAATRKSAAAAAAAWVPSSTIVNFVARANLMSGLGCKQAAKRMLTSEGYEFMLKDYESQVWEFVLDAVNCSSSQEEAFSLLFMLSYCRFGCAYPLAALTASQRALMLEFSHMGIVYLSTSHTTNGDALQLSDADEERKKEGGEWSGGKSGGANTNIVRFYPCRIAIDLIFLSGAAASRGIGFGGASAAAASAAGGEGIQVKSDSGHGSGSGKRGMVSAGRANSKFSGQLKRARFLGAGEATIGTGGRKGDLNGEKDPKKQKVRPLQVIVETNNQVTAYVTSELHLAMLRLFVDITIRMPNMALGRITREKSKEAFRTGIRAAQIIDFLSMHAHPLIDGSADKSSAGVTKSVVMNKRVIPENVTDQLALWEAEMFRIKAEDAVVIDFRDLPVGIPRSAYDNLVKILRGASSSSSSNNSSTNKGSGVGGGMLPPGLKESDSESALLWEDPQNAVIAIAPESVDFVRKYIAANIG